MRRSAVTSGRRDEDSAASLALSLGVVEEVGALRSHSSERPDAAEDITAIPVPSPSFGEEVAAQPRGHSSERLDTARDSAASLAPSPGCVEEVAAQGHSPEMLENSGGLEVDNAASAAASSAAASVPTKRKASIFIIAGYSVHPVDDGQARR